MKSKTSLNRKEERNAWDKSNMDLNEQWIKFTKMRIKMSKTIYFLLQLFISFYADKIKNGDYVTKINTKNFRNTSFECDK